MLTKEKQLPVGQSTLKDLADSGLHELVTSHLTVLSLKQKFACDISNTTI